MSDLLGGLHPRPSTPVPGLWLLPCPDVLKVYVFAAAEKEKNEETEKERNGVNGVNGREHDTLAPPDTHPHTDHATAASTTATGTSALDALRSDPFERAWVAFNSGCSEVEARSLFSRPCAVVKPAKEKGRELWVFSSEEVSTPEGLIGAYASHSYLTAEISRPEAVEIASTLTCAAHGHALGCLTNTACEPTFSPTPSWSMLEAAAGEKLAWVMGLRTSLLSSDTALGPVPFAVSLRPTTVPPAGPSGVSGPAALLLSARPRAPPHCAPSPPAPAPGCGAEPMVLRPLALPALLVAPQSVNPAQDARLSAAFDSALGPGWKAGRTEARVSAQARGSIASDWSLYFVPLGASALTGENLSSIVPGAIATKWRGAHGVLTVWPTHLALPLAPLPRPELARPPNPGPGLGASSDLLGTATGLFDFFATYSEPEPEPEDDDEPEEAEEPVLVEDDSSSKREDESVDDLFSTHSSPEPEPEVVEADVFGSTFTTPQASALELDMTGEGDVEMGPEEVNIDDMDDLFGDDEADGDETITQEHEPAPPAEPELEPEPIQPPSRMSEMTREDDTRNMITEDDFDFFDSPKPELEVATPETPKGERVFEPTGAEPVFEVISRPVSPRLHAVPHINLPLRMTLVPSIEAFAPESVISEKEAEEEAKPEETEAEPVDIVEEAPMEPLPAKKPRLCDLVPEAFAPLELRPRSKPQFPYGLPSPTATVSGLNADLIERLQASRKRKRRGKDGETVIEVPYEYDYNYSATWDYGSDSDESEEPSPFTTGAPPTPSSSGDMDDGTPGPSSATLAPPPPAMTDDEVEFDGGVCVGGEWAALKDDPAAAAPFARSWGNSWVEIKGHADAYPSPTSPKTALDRGSLLNEIDVDAFSNAVVRNRFFRTTFDATATEQVPVRPPSILIKSGVALADLTDEGADSDGIPHAKSYSIPSTSVNVGYGGAVMRISAAALRYWRELGLAPAGGPKNIVAYAVCEPGDESTRTAVAFLKDMGEVYSAHQLGSHQPGDDEGVVPTPLSGVHDTITKLRAKATKPTVIYVLTYNSSLSPSALTPLVTAPSNLSVVHVVPTASIRVPNLQPLAFEVYDMLPRPIARVNLHGKPIPLPPAWMPYHAFTVTTPEEPRPQLSLDWPQKNYDVINRWRPIHGAYTWLPDASVLVLAVTDAIGDACTIKALRMESSTAVTRATKVWDVFRTFADTMATEWTLSICSYGLMTKDDLDGEYRPGYADESLERPCGEKDGASDIAHDGTGSPAGRPTASPPTSGEYPSVNLRRSRREYHR